MSEEASIPINAAIVPQRTNMITAETIESTKPAIASPRPPWDGSFEVCDIPRMLKINPSGQHRKLQTNPAIAIPLVFCGALGVLIRSPLDA